MRPSNSIELLKAGAALALLGRPQDSHKAVVASWSGGIDSTAVIAHLAARGYDISCVTFGIYGGEMAKREARARNALIPELLAIAAFNGGSITFTRETHSPWIWAFSADGVEIPRRNKHIIDRLATVYATERRAKNLALGEYTGADTWLVQDHVEQRDADHRTLAAYLLAEYGLAWRLISLQDFGESRYKVDRVRLLAALIGDASFDTTVCLVDSEKHCGECYKCVERHAAFVRALGYDRTEYEHDPAAHPDFDVYRQQMAGFNLRAQLDNFPSSHPMPTGAPRLAEGE